MHIRCRPRWNLEHSLSMLLEPSGPTTERRGWMAGFLFRLETAEGSPADPPTLSAAVPDWRLGDTIHLGRRALRVVGTRDDDSDQPTVLVVEDVA